MKDTCRGCPNPFVCGDLGRCANGHTLNGDVARCDGVGSDAEGWREGCERCLRRIAPRAGWNGNMIAPPPIIAFECEHLIEANAEAQRSPASGDKLPPLVGDQK